MPTDPWDFAAFRARPACRFHFWKRLAMLKRIAVFAVLVLSYAVTGIALSSGPNHAGPAVASAAE